MHAVAVKHLSLESPNKPVEELLFFFNGWRNGGRNGLQNLSQDTEHFTVLEYKLISQFQGFC